MATAVIDGLFSDEVFTATELNRHVGTVLDHACVRPVTISRNNDLFALVKREYAARMIRTMAQMKSALSLLAEAHVAISGESPAPVFAWLTIYEKDDLQRLFTEVLDAVGRAASGASDWGDVQAVIHEWEESALVAKSGVLDQAMFHEPAEESPLPNPDEFLQYLEPSQMAAGESCPESTSQ